MSLAKPGPADAHDAGVLGCHWLSQVQLMLMILGFWMPLAKPGPADAHDAGVLGCHWLSQVQLMLRMRYIVAGIWGPKIFMD